MTPRLSRGFTIIELVAAIIMLAILIPPTMYALREAHFQRVNPVLASRARWLATGKIEDVIADRHSATRGYAFLVAGNYTAESPVAGAPGFARTVSFIETAADLVSAGTGYKRVIVTVSWTDALGVARSLTLSTVVTDYTA